MKMSTQVSLAAAAGLIASSSGFVAPVVPVRTLSASSSLRMTAGSEYVGTLPGAPFGNDFIFDPLNLAAGASPVDIKRWREAEIKHGRVAMLASLGILVAENFHPLFMGPDYIGPAVGHFQEITAQYPQFWVAALLGVALVEYQQITRGFAEPDSMTGMGGMKDEYTPGDLGFDPLGIKPSGLNDLMGMQTKELNNGRLAMIGVAGMLVQELVKPTAILENLL